MKKTFRRKSFTIIEALIAIFILEVGLIGLAIFFGSSLKTTRLAREQTTAANLASGLLDEQLDKAYESITIGSGTQEKYTSDSNSPFYLYDKKIDVAYVDHNLTEQGADTGMKKIVVTISWTDANNPKTFQIATIKARR